MRRRRDSAPLCPAGHLPHNGGDWQRRALAYSCNAGDWRGVGDWRKQRRRPISPQVGEMSGRTEGGVKKRYGSCFAVRPD
ncbi:hypothetical protein FJ956_15675 [Mesorhizobium sp. B2-4-3]|nr:hypothetical protein FJ956_15675 [Mesorhizobium sp. B2-4-3]